MSATGCVSCFSVLTESDSVYVSGCGHIFHLGCLSIILASDDKRCPRCYSECTSSDAQRLYLPFVNNTPERYPTDKTMSQLTILKQHCAIHERALADASREQLRLAHFDRLNTEYKEKLLPELNMLKHQKEKSEEKMNELKKLHILQMVLAGSPSDIEEILEHKLSPELLATMLVLLRREMKLVGNQKKECRVGLRGCQNKNEELNANVSKLLDKTAILEARHFHLREKLKEAKTSTDSEQ